MGNRHSLEGSRGYYHHYAAAPNSRYDFPRPRPQRKGSLDSNNININDTNNSKGISFKRVPSMGRGRDFQLRNLTGRELMTVYENEVLIDRSLDSAFNNLAWIIQSHAAKVHKSIFAPVRVQNKGPNLPIQDDWIEVEAVLEAVNAGEGHPTPGGSAGTPSENREEFYSRIQHDKRADVIESQRMKIEAALHKSGGDTNLPEEDSLKLASQEALQRPENVDIA